MSDQTTVFGIDLGTTYSCIAYVDEYGKSVVTPNSEGDYTTPSVVQFDGTQRIVGREAKNNAVLVPNQVVEMVKRQMGEPNWRFHYNGVEYTPEEISSYILRKLTTDAEQYLGHPIKDVVITCPAYFGIAQRDATVKAGQIAGLNVREIINEPTAAAIMYGLQEERDQVVLVYDLGGGTFDITVIEVKGSAITVITTGGDHNLGGRNWDEIVVLYLADQWMAETKSSDSPVDSEETLQDLWGRAEDAKKALSARQETKVVITHAGQRISSVLTRQKFDELTAALLERTIEFTKQTIDQAKSRGYTQFDQILLVGGSTRMAQVSERLTAEFNIPLRIFDPDQAVAKGAATYGYKLFIDEKIITAIAPSGESVDINKVDQQTLAKAQRKVAEEEGLALPSVNKIAGMTVTNVASHSFGIVAIDRHTDKEIISNIVLANDSLPALNMKTYGTLVESQAEVELRVMENSIHAQSVEDLFLGQEIGNAILHLPPGLPKGTPLEVTFELQRDGRLRMTGREPTTNSAIEVDIETSRGISDEEFVDAKNRSKRIVVS